MFSIYELTDPATCSSARICPERGGILISFVSHGEELLYLDEATFSDPVKNVRGGNPILFPICGQLPGCTYTWNGKDYTIKNHGVARTSPWKVEAFQNQAPGAFLTISLDSNEDTWESYPFAFRLVYTYRLENGKLIIEQDITHQAAGKGTGAAVTGPMPVHTGFHPYFQVSGKTICHNLSAPVYWDYNDQCEKPLAASYNAAGKTEAVVTDANPDGSVIFYEPSRPSRKIRLNASPEYRYLMLWSADGCDFLCVEPWTARNQEILRGEELLLVNPGETLRLWISMELWK